MEKRPILHELTLEQIEELADQLARLTHASQIYYFGSRRWDTAISFGLIEFILVTKGPSKFTLETQDEILEKLSFNIDAILTIVENDEDIVSRAILVWPIKS